MKGNELRAYRERAGLSQEELAARLKTTARTVSRWENGTEALYGVAETAVVYLFAVEALARLGPALPPPNGKARRRSAKPVERRGRPKRKGPSPEGPET